MNLLMLSTARGFDLSNPEAVSAMIGFSVRLSVPFISIVVAASAMPVLFPGELSRWWLRNRRYWGLLFAVAMAWQGAFIFILSSMHTGYYYGEVYHLRDELEGTSGYIFLSAMVLTSFPLGRKLLSPIQWKTLHRCGMYFLWAYPFSVYWWNLFYYDESPARHDYIFYGITLAAILLRIFAWGKRRNRSRSDQFTSLPVTVLGSVLATVGLVATVTGRYWFNPLSNTLLASEWSREMELWLPFWPFEPFMPVFVIGIGTWLLSGGAFSRGNDSAVTKQAE